jgi:hypothetical protein
MEFLKGIRVNVSAKQSVEENILKKASNIFEG